MNSQLIKQDIFITSIHVLNNFLNDQIRKTILNLILLNKNKIGKLSDLGKGEFRISHFKNQNYNFFKQGDQFIDFVDKELKINVKNNILEVVKLCEKDFGFYDLKLLNSWTTIQDKNSVLCRHNHAPCKLSGVFYLNVDKNGPPLTFYNPNPVIDMYDFNFYNHNTFYKFNIIPQIGDLILFPSYLNHDSNNENNEIENRVAISFNMV
jgi:uncharacterized protein (TIGR02466 family)